MAPLSGKSFYDWSAPKHFENKIEFNLFQILVLVYLKPASILPSACLLPPATLLPPAFILRHYGAAIEMLLDQKAQQLRKSFFKSLYQLAPRLPLIYAISLIQTAFNLPSAPACN